MVEAQQDILKAIENTTGRGKDGMTPDQQEIMDSAVQLLEADKGLTDPTTSDLLNGRWQLLYTSRPGTASPIQRTFTGVEAFTIFQEVMLDSNQMCRVNNVVEFGKNAEIGTLKVEAEASTDDRPLEGFVPRAGPGLALFGKSNTDPPKSPNMRINFQFDQAAFDFRNLPFNIPYPVPFKLLGDETKGWIDITYMNEEGTFRLTRGNKGTLFVLVKPPTTVIEDLMVAIREKDDQQVMKLALKLKGTSPDSAPARSDAVLGKWKLIWTEQSETANPIQKSLVGFTKNWQIIKTNSEGETMLENLVDLGIAKVRALASCNVGSDTRTEVKIAQSMAVILGQEIDLPGVTESADDNAFVDWWYLDENIRVTSGNKGSTFIHVRDD